MRPRHVVVMGVSTTGKTPVGRALAEQLGYTFVEGDAFHPQTNLDKMASGRALDDDDRRPWLLVLAREIARLEAAGSPSVTSCSALRRGYRDWLRAAYPQLFFLHLAGGYDVVRQRAEARDGVLPPSLLQSQFEELEPLEPDEWGAVVHVAEPYQEVIDRALRVVRRAGPCPSRA